MLDLKNLSGALVVGAGHGIGFALVEALLRNHGVKNLVATYRRKELAGPLLKLAAEYPELSVLECDPLEKRDKLVGLLRTRDISLQLLINACGLLHDQKLSPEKNLRQFNRDSFLRLMEVNALLTPLLLKDLVEFIPRGEDALVVALSAKVGSIEDNRLGGWYSYRASKAALNMLMKTAAIELKRTHKKLTLLSLHPGTTKTALSEPFLAGTSYQVHEPAATALNLLRVMEESDPAMSGGLYSWDGSKLPY